MVKVRMGNRKVMDTKQGSLGMKMGQGGIRIGVLVWGYTECNIGAICPDVNILVSCTLSMVNI